MDCTSTGRVRLSAVGLRPGGASATISIHEDAPVFIIQGAARRHDPLLRKSPRGSAADHGQWLSLQTNRTDLRVYEDDGIYLN
jgi:hypothetical protein